eukprot:5416739-Prymnesium_polylepis.3
MGRAVNYDLPAQPTHRAHRTHTSTSHVRRRRLIFSDNYGPDAPDTPGFFSRAHASVVRSDWRRVRRVLASGGKVWPSAIVQQQQLVEVDHLVAVHVKIQEELVEVIAAVRRPAVLLRDQRQQRGELVAREEAIA